MVNKNISNVVVHIFRFAGQKNSPNSANGYQRICAFSNCINKYGGVLHRNDMECMVL